MVTAEGLDPMTIPAADILKAISDSMTTVLSVAQSNHRHYRHVDGFLICSEALVDEMARNASQAVLMAIHEFYETRSADCDEQAERALVP